MSSNTLVLFIVKDFACTVPPCRAPLSGDRDTIYREKIQFSFPQTSTSNKFSKLGGLYARRRLSRRMPKFSSVPEACFPVEFDLLPVYRVHSSVFRWNYNKLADGNVP